MERLTKRELIELNNGKKYVDCNYKDDECNDSCMYDFCKWNEKALKKLKEYEDAEEQVLNATGADLKSMIGEFMHYYNLQKEGRLKELPCKIGDIVYEANKYWSEVIPRTVASIAFYKNSIWLRDGCGDSFEYGIEAFLTMEEAEAALAEMEK